MQSKREIKKEKEKEKIEEGTLTILRGRLPLAIGIPRDFTEMSQKSIVFFSLSLFSSFFFSWLVNGEILS